MLVGSNKPFRLQINNDFDKRSEILSKKFCKNLIIS